MSITVNTPLDELDGSIVDGDISLRDAIAAATAGEMIDFSVTGTIVMDDALGEMAISKTLTITGPRADQLTIDAGNGADNIFNTGDGYRIFNSAGGGILNSGTSTITSSTLSDNSAIFDGGGIRDLFATTIDNTIVAGNMAGSGPDVLGTASGTFNLIGNGTGLSGITDGIDGNQVGSIGSPINPMLDSLADKGGLTATHSLLAGSPVIDMGDPDFVAPPIFDQRGAPFIRVANGRIDVGAVEDQLNSNSADFDTDGDVDGADFLAWQRGSGITSGAARTVWRSNHPRTNHPRTELRVAKVPV